MDTAAMIFLRFHDGDRLLMINLAHVAVIANLAVGLQVLMMDGNEYIAPCSAEQLHSHLVEPIASTGAVRVIDL